MQKSFPKIIVTAGICAAVVYWLKNQDEMERSLLDLRKDARDQTKRLDTLIKGLYERYHELAGLNSEQLDVLGDTTTTTLFTNSKFSNQDVYEQLEGWRLERSARDDVSPHMIFNNTTLMELAIRRPITNQDLLAVPGLGKVKVERYGKELINILESYQETKTKQ